ncbi:MAG: mechanosensitive ion channel family protein [Verrucomicrobiota bacterium]|nr:mechanosensitive ion channel family protein [Verrucomicrobiota bacterium]
MTFDMTEALRGVREMGNGFLERLPYIVVALVVFSVFYFAGKGIRSVIRRVSRKRRRHGNVGLVLGRLAQAGVIFLGLMIALVIALPTFKPAQLVQFLGISSVAIGFAFRDILQNFLAGILLLWNEPFRIGDQIKMGEIEGDVEEIETRATMIRTYDGRRVVVPNGELFTNAVTVNTAYDKRRLEYDVGIGYGDDLERARELMLQAMRSIEDVLADPAPDVLVYEFGGSSVNLRARWWIAPPRRTDALQSRDRVLTAIKKALAENGIDLPFPTQQVLFHDQTEATDGDRARQREGWPAGKGEVPQPRSIAAAISRRGRSGGCDEKADAAPLAGTA